MRTLKSSDASLPTLDGERPGWVRVRRTYVFLTPMLGGGVEFSEVQGEKPHDPVTPVRVPSLRGQLRFWWRATNPHAETDPKALRERESRIFGAASAPGRLDVAIARAPRAPAALPVLEGKFGAKKGLEALAYGAFPLRGKSETHGVLWSFGAETFEVSFCYDQEVAHDVLAAIWGWSHFGGLGGRTRRGFGAVRDVTSAAGTPPLLTLEEGWKTYVRSNGGSWPQLFRDLDKESLAVGREVHVAGIDAQKSLLEAFRKLRQGVGLGRNSGQSSLRPGRSRWPEADTLRQITGQSHPDHRSPTTQTRGFPRAEFGLPIVFHMKDREDPSATLEPQGGGRFPSPLILRPHARPDGKVEALALRLQASEPASFSIYGQHKGEWSWNVPYDPAAIEPLGGLDPIQRYFEEIRK